MAAQEKEALDAALKDVGEQLREAKERLCAHDVHLGARTPAGRFLTVDQVIACCLHLIARDCT